jgi:flavin-binding protein dodecin
VGIKNTSYITIRKEIIMSVAKVSEIIASSKNSFDDALIKGVQRANKTLKNVKSAWVKDQTVEIKNGKIDEYRVALMITFILDD